MYQELILERKISESLYMCLIWVQSTLMISTKHQRNMSTNTSWNNPAYFRGIW